MPDQPQSLVPSQAKIDSFIRNLVKVDEICRVMTGLPVDVLMAQTRQLAATSALPAIGRMMDYGNGPQLVVESKCLEQWLTGYFQQVQRAVATPQETVGEV